VSAYGVDNEIVEEIQKFPYPFQKLLFKEACAVMNRIESGKNAPGLTSLDCDCLFMNKYLLPCKHIFHEHMYGSTRLLTDDVWRTFRNMFEENGFEVYERREQIVIPVVQTDEQRRIGSQRLTVNELIERVRDMYWRIEESGSREQVDSFIENLERSLNPILRGESE